MAGFKKPALSRHSPSFQLRNSSLNTLRLRRVFDLFDRNADGEISLEELVQALHRLGMEGNPSNLSSIVALHIKPGRTGLEFDDFQSLHRSLGDSMFDVDEEGDEVAESDLTEAFKVFDEDGDGFICAKELQTVLGKLGLPEGKEMVDVHRMIGAVDHNKDGRVDFEEFKQMIRSISVESS